MKDSKQQITVYLIQSIWRLPIIINSTKNNLLFLLREKNLDCVIFFWLAHRLVKELSVLNWIQPFLPIKLLQMLYFGKPNQFFVIICWHLFMIVFKFTLKYSLILQTITLIISVIHLQSTSFYNLIWPNILIWAINIVYLFINQISKVKLSFVQLR